MSYVQRYICIYVALLMIIMGVGIARGRSSLRHRVSAQGQPPYQILDVDKSGNANFSTIQSAIDSVPSNNTNWVTINIKAGTYNEQVKIPLDKPMIHLKGEGQQTTNVVWGGDNILTGATLISEADNILVQNINFTNSYNYPPEKNQNPIKPATAVMINGDKTAFYGCGFFGLQDTLWDAKGRHYFKDCTIQGGVDFIMGAGQSIYDNCAIEAIPKDLGTGLVGFITAQSRSDPSDKGGFVFKDCTVNGNGPAYLGRPWRDYARVVFSQSFLSDIIVPQGWSDWTSTDSVKGVTFAEEGCHGPGSNTSNRVQWVNKLSPMMLKRLTSMSFIDSEGWISQQPINMLA